MMSDVQATRQAIVEALPLTTSNHGEEPNHRFVYVPPAHIKALRLECNLVVGARGVGKSFWTAALSSQVLRTSLGQSIRDLERTDVHIGFAVSPDIDSFPTDDVFAHLMLNGASPYDVWRAVVVRWIAKAIDETVPVNDWSTTVNWVKENPEPLARLVHRTNQKLLEDNRYAMIVFDALDRTSNDWRTMDGIVRDLLRVVLWLKSYPRLHAKVFLREDQFDRTITDFPDASKLLSTKADLTWASHDLHGLLWQMFCNAQDGHGTILREKYRKVVGVLPSERDGVFQLSEEVKRDGPKLRGLFEEIAGPWMGRDRRRGIPYVWSVSHLADGLGRTSPRSFLAAIRAAGDDSIDKYPDYTFALHYESIKRGVQKASEIRVAEMAEDYPWVTRVMDPLRGLTVPSNFSLIEERWKDGISDVLGTASIDRLPPQHAARGWRGVRNDLERLGIFETMKDDRVNLPDLYRVGFGLGRRGGILPLK
ncbi:hypothetical protein PQR08_13390 [Caballeronia jiangsuensis]|uniref:Uncharacterized protein n=1 Tax=Caballeronia jiangsuensis TaxID=1458357 RepID=A0ABW9CJR8_9BURK